MPLKFLYFDLGNVLVTFSNEQMCRQMAAVAGISEQQVADLLIPTGCKGDLQWKFEAGQFTGDEYYELFCEQTGSSPNRTELKLACADMFAPIEESFELAASLYRAGHRLGLLSNTNTWHWQFLLDGRYPVLNEAFEIELTSFAAQNMKPDRAIYQQAIERAGVSAEEIFFTDDRPENVAGAQAAGIDAVQFRSTEQLAEELAARGIEW